MRIAKRFLRKQGDGPPVGRWLVLNLFLLAFVFQVFLVTRWRPLYALLKVLFLALLLLILLGVLRLARRETALLACLLFILAVRIPFYVHPDGLLFNSDNALEALQPLEIRDAKAAPFFLLDSSSHNGTLKYLCLAFLYEGFGSGFLVFLSFQILIYLGLMVVLFGVFRRMFDRNALLPLFFAHFAFIEVLFDYSLFLRSGPYLEMLFFFALGVSLFDFTFRDLRRVFLAVYFLMTAVYLHSLAVFLVTPLVGVAALYALRARAFPRAAAVLAAGAAAGQFHFVYYKLFYPPPPPSPIYAIHFYDFGDFALSRIPSTLAQVARDFFAAFHNILSFEFSYVRENWGSFEYNFQSETAATLLHLLNRFLVFFSLLIFLAALVLVLTRLRRRRFFGAAERDWIYPFFLFLLGVILGKLFLLSPSPRPEPRHNIDLAFLLLLGAVIVFCKFLKGKALFSWRPVLTAALLLLLAAPGYFSFLRVAAFKRDSYREIMPALEANGVKYLSADFGIAYIVHFLSERRIFVSDTVGPTTFDFFYPRMRERVDRVPRERKAHLFYTPRYPVDAFFRAVSRELFETVRDALTAEGKKFTIVRWKYYVLIIPEESRFYGPEAVP